MTKQHITIHQYFTKAEVCAALGLEPDAQITITFDSEPPFNAMYLNDEDKIFLTAVEHTYAETINAPK